MNNGQDYQPCDRVLSLDMARNTGFAISIDGFLYQSGTKTFNGKGYSKIIELQTFIINVVNGMEIDKVIVEYAITNNRYRTMHSKMEAIGMCAIALAVCDMENIPYVGINPTTLKKNFCGDGKATKAKMMKHARSLGLEFNDDNECDALALLVVHGHLTNCNSF